VEKIQERKQLSFREDDMGNPFCSSVLNVKKAAGNPKKKPSSQILRVKKIQEMKGLSFIEDNIWDP
jgi:alkyl hydroperoxide reductase subunit AhpF